MRPGFPVWVKFPLLISNSYNILQYISTHKQFLNISQYILTQILLTTPQIIFRQPFNNFPTILKFLPNRTFVDGMFPKSHFIATVPRLVYIITLFDTMFIVLFFSFFSFLSFFLLLHFYNSFFPLRSNGVIPV